MRRRASAVSNQAPGPRTRGFVSLVVLDLHPHGLGWPIMPRAVAPAGSSILVDAKGSPVTVSAGLAAQVQHRSPAAELLLDALKELVPDDPR